MEKEIKLPIELIGLENLKIKIGEEIVPFTTSNDKVNDMVNKLILENIKIEDSLQYMMDCQRTFQGRFGEDFTKMSNKERAAFIKNHGYFIIEELVEMFRETPFHKNWKDYSEWSEEKMLEQWVAAQEEYIDVIHFVINVGLALGLNSNDILRMYKEKNKLNIQRQEDPNLGYVNK